MTNPRVPAALTAYKSAMAAARSTYRAGMKPLVTWPAPGAPNRSTGLGRKLFQQQRMTLFRQRQTASKAARLTYRSALKGG